MPNFLGSDLLGPDFLEIAFQPVYETSAEIDQALILLSESELLEFHQYSIPKRRFQWLAGRIACKKAVELILFKENFDSLQPAQIVLAPSFGQPPTLLLPKGYPSKVKISLSHSNELACAIACLESQSYENIGIDLEKLNWIDLDTFLPLSFTDREQQWVRDEYWRLFQFWTAKEALLKALGLGLNVDLREVEIFPQQVSHPFHRLAEAHFRGVTYPIASRHNHTYFWSWCRSKSASIPT
jgi:phosphopantetheinyl transferase